MIQTIELSIGVDHNQIGTLGTAQAENFIRLINDNWNFICGSHDVIQRVLWTTSILDFASWLPWFC